MQRHAVTASGDWYRVSSLAMRLGRTRSAFVSVDHSKLMFLLSVVRACVRDRDNV
jgi:hypothetical protein